MYRFPRTCNMLSPAIFVAIIVICLPISSHQFQAYFPGNGNVQLRYNLDFVYGISFSIRTCNNDKVAQIFHQSGDDGNIFTFILLDDGELRLKWKVNGLEGSSIIGRNLNNNEWHEISMKNPNGTSLLVKVDEAFTVLANTSHQSYLLKLISLPGSLIMGQNYEGCMDDTNSQLFSSTYARFASSIKLDSCPLNSYSKCPNKTCSKDCKNGGTCVTNVNGEHTCQCTDGYSGDECQVYLNPCDSNPCMNNAQCSAVSNGYVCLCPSVFTGQHCETLMDPCSSDPCLNNGVCSINPSNVTGYQCSCSEEWTGALCETRQDACLSNPCSHGSCVSSPDADGGYVCECEEGYTGTQCSNVVADCSSITCGTGKVCVNHASGPKCRCPPGFSGELCDLKVTDCTEDYCFNGGTCILANGQVSCSCPSGWKGETCEEDEDECINKPCIHGICQNQPGSFQCYCLPGYSGENCEKEFNECLLNKCLNGATCEDRVNNYFCRCSPGFIGRDCEREIDECESMPCQNGATCIDLVNDFNCSCVAGFTGKQCEINIDECASSPCQNYGQCTDLINGFECNCTDTGFSGDFCEINIDDCEIQPCVSDSNCTDLIKDYNCTCHPGYTGKNCEIDIDECLVEQPCENGATCLQKSNHSLYELQYNSFFQKPFSFSSSGGYICECLLGFNGTDCENNIDDCVNHECVNGTCVDGINEYVCNCTRGFEGVFCDTEIDECLRYDPCQNGASCTDLVGDYNCNCVENYGGKNCSIELIGCQNHECLNSATCVPSLNDLGEHIYSCICTSGFYGNFCEVTSALSFHGNGYIIAQELTTTKEDGSFDITFDFKTTLPNGVLAVGSNYDSSQNFVLALKDRKVSMNVTSNNLVTSLVVNKDASVGKDYVKTVISIDNQNVILSVEDSTDSQNFFFQSPEALSRLNFGGYGFNSELYDGIQPFTGCMQDIVINQLHRVSYQKSSSHQDVIEYCDRVEQCNPSPCKNDGYCVDLWNNFTCLCHRPYFGPTCQEYDSPATFGFENIKSSARVDIQPHVQNLLRDKLNISLIIRTLKEDGIILYLGPSISNNQAAVNYILVQLSEGRLEVIFNNKRENEVSSPILNNGYYHVLQITLINGVQKAYVNGTLVFSEDSFGSLNLDPQVLYLGGITDQSSNSNRQKRQALENILNQNDNFKGIIWDVKVNGLSIPLFPNSTVENEILAVPNVTDIVYGIQSDNTCNPNPCDNGVCNVTWNDYKCECPPAFRGKNCSDHKPCSIYSCPTGGTCIDLDHGYECITKATFNGKDSAIDYTGNFSSKIEFHKISFKYRTNTTDRTILNLRNPSSFLSIIVKDQIEVISDLGVKSVFGNAASDGEWHDVEIEFNKTHITGVYDKIQTIQVFGVDLNAFFLSNPEIHLGFDGEHLNANVDQKKETSYFKGCIEKFRIGELLLPFFNRSKMLNDTSIDYFKPTSHIPESIQIDHCELCFNFDCKHSSFCVNSTQFYNCQCPNGYNGKFCEVNIDECISNDCQNGAICLDGINNYTCDCPLGYDGDFCQNDLCVECKHGECARLKKSFYCNCSNTYTGKYCDKPKTCEDNPCTSNGQCFNAVGNATQFTCKCLPGYTGLFCESEIDYCASSPCMNNATCQSVVSKQDYMCACHQGWTGKQCDQNKDDCINHDCENGASCIDKLNGFTCVCTDNFKGPKCSDDVDECLIDNLCENNGSCVNTYGNFSCTCPSGWVGQTCNITDLCYLQNFRCVNGGLCTMNLLTSESHCECPPSYSGQFCAIKDVEDRDENLAILIGPIVGIFLLLCLIAGLSTFFMMAKKKRATRGTYSPSRQEMFGSRVEMGNVMKPPPEERLI